MNRFKNIMVVYNDAIGADDALTQAVALARANRARLTLVDVVSPGFRSRAALLERQKRLHRTINALKSDGIETCGARVLTGNDATEIVRQVGKAKHDMVIASADGGGMIRNALYGNTAGHLMRKCPCPVWIVKPGQTRPYAKVLAAIDPDPTDPAEDTLDVKIMDMATSLAGMHRAELHVVHAWVVTGSDRDTLRSEIRDSTRQQLLQKHEQARRTRIEQLLGRYRLARTRHFMHLPRGLPEREIPQAARLHDIDVIVMGTANRTGLTRMLIGSAAESILSAVRCGVLAVKPDAPAVATAHEDDEVERVAA